MFNFIKTAFIKLYRMFNSNEYVENIDIKSLNINDIDVKLLENKNVITILLDGSMRFVNDNITLIESLKNNLHFEFICVIDKTGNRFIIEYCTENKINNICFLDKKGFTEDNMLLKNIDFIAVFYSRFYKYIRYAFIEKLMFAAYYQKPVITFDNIITNSIFKKYKIGISLDKTLCESEKEIIRYIDAYDSVSRFIEYKKFLTEYNKSSEKSVSDKTNNKINKNKSLDYTL